MNYEHRIRNPFQDISIDTWRLLEEKPPEAATLLADALELAVTQGYFGLAGELSDAIASEFIEELESNRALRSRLLVERMKRWIYMGYKVAARRAAHRAIADARSWLVESSTHEPVHTLRTCLGYLGWLTIDVEDLRMILEETYMLNAKLEQGTVKYVESKAFSQALEGRLYALCGEGDACDKSFRKALHLLAGNAYLRSRAHALVLHAEHLVYVGRCEDALLVSRALLVEGTKTKLRSHLLFRAMYILINNESHEQPTSRRALELRWYTLLQAMGLSQSLPIYPVLSEAVSSITKLPSPDWFLHDIEASLTWWLGQVTPQAMERIVADSYRMEGFLVDELGGSTPALDLVATSKGNGLHPSLSVGIQVKRWKTKVNKDSIPRSGDLKSAVDLIRKRGHSELNSLHWYCASGLSSPAEEELRSITADILGPGCVVTVTDLPDLVRQLSARPLLLPHLVFSTALEEGIDE